MSTFVGTASEDFGRCLPDVRSVGLRETAKLTELATASAVRFMGRPENCKSISVRLRKRSRQAVADSLESDDNETLSSSVQKIVAVNLSHQIARGAKG